MYLTLMAFCATEDRKHKQHRDMSMNVIFLVCVGMHVFLCVCARMCVKMWM